MYINFLAIDFCEKSNIQKIFMFLGNFINIIKIAIPILLVIMGTIDLVKAIVTQKQEEMKKEYSILIKRIIIGVVIFFIPSLVNFVLNMANDGIDKNKCMSCFSNPNTCSVGTIVKKNSNATEVSCARFHNDKNGCQNNKCEYTNSNKCMKLQ